MQSRILDSSAEPSEKNMFLSGVLVIVVSVNEQTVLWVDVYQPILKLNSLTALDTRREAVK